MYPPTMASRLLGKQWSETGLKCHSLDGSLCDSWARIAGSKDNARMRGSQRAAGYLHMV